ncbi:MAG: hypothetical protein Q9M91_00355 [Candidatus Dojkabacteria bacterium]|nr:hypothetical protein [Candidatus Dojkabacteria bacterium]MDQ7020283.1 hypothetical protein [Candidatus Dojkabacteria bacterium]
MKVKRFITILFSAIVLTLPLLTGKADAQQESAFRGIILDEFRYDLGLVQPGEVIQKSFTIKHDFQPREDGSVRDITVYPEPRDIGQDGDTRTFIYDLPYETSLASWIELGQTSFYFDQQEEEGEVTFTIIVPQNAEPGSRAAGIYILNKDGDIAVEELTEDQVGAGLNGAPGVQIFLTVDGEINSDLKLDSLYTTDIKGDEKSLLWNPPVNIVAEFANNGNVYSVPRGRVIIHKDENFVESEITSFELNPDQLRVLPGNTRAFIFTWKPDSPIYSEAETVDGETSYSTKYDITKALDLKMGKYLVTVQFQTASDTGVTSQTVTMSTDFRLFPWQVILLLLALLLIGGFVTYRKVKSKK